MNPIAAVSIPVAAVLLIAVPTAHADTLVQVDAQGVCNMLQAGGQNPYLGQANALAAAANYMLQKGTTPQQVRDVFAYAANVTCPRYHDVITQTVNSWGAGNAPGPSASARNSADCVPNVDHNAVQGQPCHSWTQYPFGLDANGNALICTSYSAGYTDATGIQWKGAWSSAPPLIGMRDPGTPCSGSSEAAQSPDGKPMICEGGAWTPH
jgi:hypothetical protein